MDGKKSENKGRLHDGSNSEVQIKLKEIDGTV